MARLSAADAQIGAKLTDEDVRESLREMYWIFSVCKKVKEAPLQECRQAKIAAQIVHNHDEEKVSSTDLKRLDLFLEFRAKLEAVRG